MIETLKRLEKQIEESRKRIEELKAQLTEMETTRADIGFSEYEGEKDYLQLQIEKEEELLKETNAKYEELKPQEIKMYEETIEESRKRIEELKAQIQEMETTRADIGFSEYEGEKDYLQLQIEKEEERIKEATSRIEEYSNEKSSTENLEKNNYEETIEESRKRIEELNAQIQEMETTRADIGFSEYESEKDYLQLQIEKEEEKIRELTEKQNKEALKVNYENLEIDSLREELEKATEEMENSISRMQEIFTEERKKREEGPYTEEELNALETEYTNKKVAEGEIFTAARNKKDQLEKLISEKEQELEKKKSEQSKDVTVYNDIENQISASEKEPYNKLKATPEKFKNIKRNVDKKIKAVRKTTGEQKRKGEPVPQDMIGASKDIPLLPKPEKQEPLLLTGPVLTETPLLPEPKEEQKQEVEPKTNEPISIYGILKKIREDAITKENQNLFQSKNTSRYKRSRLVVSKQFKEELHSGNYIYNIVHTVPAMAKTAFGFVSKISAKLLKNKDTDKLIQKLKENAEKLTPEEKEILFQEYKGNNLLTYKQPAAIDMVIQEVISKYALGKVTALNNDIEKSYGIIIDAIRKKQINVDALNKENISEKEKAALMKANEKFEIEAAAAIDFITEAKKEANNILSGGLHGFTEDLKAKASKMNFVGMRFSKESFDPELDNKLAELEEKYKYSTSPSEKLEAFKLFEMLHSKHTIIEKSIFGERSVGEKYYSPIVKQLDYNPDPFIRDCLTSIAMVTGVVSGINGHLVHEHQADKLLAEHQANVANANQQNAESIAYANEAGDTIVNGQDTISEGFIAQAYQNNATMSGIVERTVADKNIWGIGSSSYKVDDAAGHLFYNETFSQTHDNIIEIANDFESGTIDQATALELFGNVAINSQATLGNVVEQCLPYLQEYAKNHPQFDLTAFEETMSHIAQNPTAISDMQQVVMDISGYGEGLANLTVEEVSALQSLPSDLLTTMLGVVSSVALATNVSKSMNYKYGKSNNYGEDNITKEMSKLVDEHQDEINAMLEKEELEELEELEEKTI